MNLSFLLLAFFAFLAMACPPPFNNPLFLDINDTSAAIQDMMFGGSLGWAEVVSISSNPRNTWPKQGSPIQGKIPNRIQYCFQTNYDMQVNRQIIEKAHNLWKAVIGEPGPSSGHSLVLQEHPEKICTDPKTRQRKPSIADDTLVIKSSDYVWAGAITGYIPSRQGIQPVAGRHHLVLDPELGMSWGDQSSVATVAHELGHVFGLWHEHQRPDRDHYITFQCDRLMGYQRVVQEVRDRGIHTMDQVCHDPHIGHQYNFASPSFSKLPETDRSGVEQKVAHGQQYDLDSIMHYSSRMQFDNKYDSLNVRNYPLAKWKAGSASFQPASPPVINVNTATVVHSNLVPSEQDKAAIKRLYPWNR